MSCWSTLHHVSVGKCNTGYFPLQQSHSDSPLAGLNRPGPPRRSSPAPRSSASPRPRTEPSTSAGRWLWWRAPAPSCAASAAARRTPPGSARWCPGWAAGWPSRTGRSRRRAGAPPSSSRWSTRCGTAAARSSPCPSSGGSRRRCGWCRSRRGTFAQSVGPPPTAGSRTGSRWPGTAPLPWRIWCSDPWLRRTATGRSGTRTLVGTSARVGPGSWRWWADWPNRCPAGPSPPDRTPACRKRKICAPVSTPKGRLLQLNSQWRPRQT